MIPTVQREVDTFIHVIWNTHRIRAQKETFLPDGVPDHIYSFPEKYGLEECSIFIILLFQQVFLSTPCKISFKSTSGFVEHCCFINIGVCPFKYHKVKQGMSGGDH